MFRRKQVLPPCESSAALSEARIPVFVLSTFDTDYLLVQAANASRAADALAAAGCTITSAAPAP